MKCACGCNLSLAMRDVLRELAGFTLGDFRPEMGPHAIARHMPGRDHMSVRSSLHALRRRRLVRPTTAFDTWRITDAGELWCKEHTT